MKPELQRIKIAEACGWKYEPRKLQLSGIPIEDSFPWIKPNGSRAYPQEIHDYLNSLDAMHEAEKALTETQFQSYLDWLDVSCGGELALSEMIDGPAFGFGLVHATAAQRGEAFLRTLSLWQE